MSTRHQKNILEILSSVLFIIVIIFIPWETVRGSSFADVQNYVARINQLKDFGADYFLWENTFIGLLKFEFLWFQLLDFSSQINIDPLLFLNILTGISAFLLHRYMIASLGGWWSFVILINPITIDLLSSQIRSALAFSLFLTVISLKLKPSIDWTRYIWLILLPFIHTGMIVVLAFYALSNFLAKIRHPRSTGKVLISIILAIGVAASITFFTTTIFSAVGDRRNFLLIETKSFSYVLFWLLWGIALALSISRENCQRWEYFFAMTICISAPLMDILGTSGFRFIALSIPIIFSTLPLLSKQIKKIIILVLPFYWFVTFFYWLR
jgi:hypothetical protein